MTDELDWILLHYGGYCCGQVEASDVDKQFFEAKQAILSDLLEIIPKEVDTKKYKCDDSEYSFMLGYIQACIEIEEKVKKYCE